MRGIKIYIGSLRIEVHFTVTFLFLLAVLGAKVIFDSKIYESGFVPEILMWAFGLVYAVGVIWSFLVHELSHYLVAKWFGGDAESVNLYFFGGVSVINFEDSPGRIFLIMVAGPVSNLLLSLVFFAILSLTHLQFLQEEQIAIVTMRVLFWYLVKLNLILAVLNLIPAPPLDGGNALMSALEFFKVGKIKSATIALIATFILFLIVLFFAFMTINPLLALSVFLFGLFCLSKAKKNLRNLRIEARISREK